jgi:hypothetical protein
MKALVLAALLASVNTATAQAQTPPNSAAAGQGTTASQQTMMLKQVMEANRQKLTKYQ